MNSQLKIEEFLRTFPEKINVVLRELQANTLLLNELKYTMNSLGKRLDILEAQNSNKLSDAIIN